MKAFRALLAGLIAFASGCATKTEILPLTSLDTAPFEQSWKRPTIDKSVEGNPLSIGGQKYAHGLGSHADSRFLIELNGATKFQAVVGVDDGAARPGAIRFRAYLDQKLAFDSGKLAAGDAGKKIDLSLKGAKQLLLVSNSAKDNSDYCHADFADARFEYVGKAPRSIPLPVEAAEILTPPPARTPRINSPKTFGVRPGSPILYTVVATGEKPIQFSADKLPGGVSLDAATGQLSGKITTAGEFEIIFTATNTLGSDQRKLKLVVGDQLALTPPMGWNSWNCFAHAIDEGKVKSAADAMVSSGLIDHGWTYINIDDFWEKNPKSKDPTLGGPGRDAAGRIVPNPRFPDMKALADYVHAKGLKIGIYSSPGPLTCGGCVGSFDHEAADAKSYADWGIDYLKYDWCSYAPSFEAQRGKPIDLLTTKVFSGSTPKDKQELMRPYALMGELLRQQNRDIVYSLCQYGMGQVWNWGDQVRGNAWRTTHDITDTWSSMSSIGFGQTDKLGVTRPGHWSDPDMLVVGKVGWGRLKPTRLTPNEQYTHVSLWSILSAPLLIGCDMSQLDDFTLNLLTNDEVIAINQDPLGKQAKRVMQVDETEVWTKELEDGSVAVAIFNRSEIEQTVAAKWSDLGISGKRVVRDLWRQKDIGTSNGEFSASIPRHGVKFVKLSKAK